MALFITEHRGVGGAAVQAEDEGAGNSEPRLERAKGRLLSTPQKTHSRSPHAQGKAPPELVWPLGRKLKSGKFFFLVLLLSRPRHSC